MDVGRHAGHTVDVSGVVSSSGVAVEPLVLERLPSCEGGLLAAFEAPNGVNRRVDVALLKQGPALVEVGQLVFHHHGLKRQLASVRLHLKLEVGPTTLKALLAQFLGAVSELERSVNRAPVKWHGDDAVAVHLNHGSVGQVADGPHPIGPRRQRKQVGDDHARLLCQVLHGRWPMAVSCKVKHVTEALLREAAVKVDGCVHDHVVVAQ